MNLANLDTYSLAEHGDGREREWWPLLENSFPNYQVFWQRYVVPLTHRIDASIPAFDRRWYRMRAGIPPRFQALAITHYSVFYFAARALARLNEPGKLFPEDVVFLLETCGENALHFFDAVTALLSDFGLDGPKERQYPNSFPDVFKNIHAYRCVILHNPVIGRAERKGSQYLPLIEHLEEYKFSWSAVEQLKDDQLVPARKLFCEYAADTVEYLNNKWEELIETFDKVRTRDKFLCLLLPSGLTEIPPAPHLTIDVTAPNAASGTDYR